MNIDLYGAFLSSNLKVDASNVYSIHPNSRSFKDLISRICSNIDIIVEVVNMKTTGTHTLEEFVTSNQYFPIGQNETFRSEYRKTIDFGALPSAAGTKSVAHNIKFNSSTIFTGINAIASDTTSKKYLPIPYASSTSSDIIEINVDNNNVNIIVGKNYSDFDQVIVILSYLKT